jgi:hypothetical protein
MKSVCHLTLSLALHEQFQWDSRQSHVKSLLSFQVRCFESDIKIQASTAHMSDFDNDPAFG